MSESEDDPALRARQMGEALYARINPRHELSGPARRYAHATPVDMARELPTLRGESTMALSPASLVTRALHTTSDSPIIRGDRLGRVLRATCQAASSGIRRLGLKTTITAENEASWSLFNSFAENMDAELDHEPHYKEDMHFGGKHATEYMVTISDIDRSAAE